MDKVYSLGVDIGSTTVKTVILDDGKIIWSKYQRHFSKVRETAAEQVEEIGKMFPDARFKLAITGSAGLGLANAASLPFVQEVHSAFISVKHDYPDADCVIELGGEDAKIIFLTGGTEQRMNGSCAGGTGAFIDQMATLLDTDAAGLNEMAAQYETLYPIASRCGVFAKTDLQPLINDGAAKPDLAASIFTAVATQTIAGLASGRPIHGTVIFLGGPLFFMSELRAAFKRALDGKVDEFIVPTDAHLYVAYGAALQADQDGDDLD